MLGGPRNRAPRDPDAPLRPTPRRRRTSAWPLWISPDRSSTSSACPFEPDVEPPAAVTVRLQGMVAGEPRHPWGNHHSDLDGSDPGWTRTSGLGIRNPALYPPELRGQVGGRRAVEPPPDCTSRGRLCAIRGGRRPTASDRVERRRPDCRASRLNVVTCGSRLRRGPAGRTCASAGKRLSSVTASTLS